MPHPAILEALKMTAREWGEVPDGLPRQELMAKAVKIIEKRKAEDPATQSLHDRIKGLEARFAMAEDKEQAGPGGELDGLKQTLAALQRGVDGLTQRLDKIEKGE